MLRARRYSIWLGLALAVEACGGATHPPALTATANATAVTVRDFSADLAGVRAANPDVKLSRSSAGPGASEPTLLVAYPAPSSDPGSRDVWCDATRTDWSRARAVSFRVKSEHALKLSFSFFDRNRVAYTTWLELAGGSDWQPLRIAFDQMQPNPYFQPPDAKVGAALDLTEIKGFAFAPQDRAAGQLWVGRFSLTQ